MSEEEVITFDEEYDDDEYEDVVRTYKQITLRELAEAIRKNGISHVRGSWFETGAAKKVGNLTYFEVSGGCALGQAGINLGFNPANFEIHRAEFADDTIYHDLSSLPSRIISMNDDEGKSLDTIATEIEQTYAEYLDVKATVEEVDYTHGVPSYVLDSM